MQKAVQHTALPTQTEALSQPAIAGIASAMEMMKKFARDIATARRNRRAVQDLRGLDKRMLADIGIDRSEIMSVVYGKSDRIR